MSNTINFKVNPYQQQFGGPGQPLPNVDAEKLKQGVNNSPVAKVGQNENPAVTAGLMIPIWVAISKLMTKFNHSCADKADGSKNTLQKISEFGDKLDKSKALNNPTVGKIGKFYNRSKNIIKTNFIDKSAVLRAFFYTPSVPTNKMALTQSMGTIAEVANDAAMAFGKYTDNGKDLKKVAELGFKNYEKAMKDPRAHIDEIIEVCKKKGSQEFVDMTKKGSFQPVRNLMGRKIYFSEIKNKLTALKGGNTLGKALPKTSLRLMEGLTNGTAGGKIAILMQAYFLADAAVRTHKAAKGEKGKTFAENLIYNVGWYMTMPLGINLMHKFGGLQYTGMSKARVRKYRQAVEQFNEKAKANGFADKKEYDAAAKAIKEMRNGKAAKFSIAKAKAAGHNLKGSKTVRFWHKPFIKVGRAITVGLENLRGFTKSTDSAFVKNVKNLGFKMKDITGYPVRVGLFMLVISPFLGKLCAKASHLVFGKPTVSILDEGKEDKTKTTEIATGPVNAAVQAKIQNQVEPTGSLINAHIAGPQVQAQPKAKSMATTKATTQPMTTQLPKTEQTKSSAPKRTYSYVPSPAGVIIQPSAAQMQVNEKLNAAYNKANIAEQEALRFLAGH